jgi:hypothetical protein
MDIVLYTQPFFDFLNLPPDQMLMRLLLLYAWIPFMFLFMYFLFVLYVDEIQGRWFSKQKFILLALDVPRANEQSPKSVENLLTYLAGAHGTLNLMDKFVEGKMQLLFSFEIVSIGGYTQFIIHLPIGFRNLVETAVYSQYPDAEITEIQDYTTGFPTTFPDTDYDVWGAEFVPASGDWILPIRTYKDFEHDLGKPEMRFRDPISSLMDLCSSLRAGENLWFQILIRPTDIAWTKKGEPAIGKILGEKPKAKKNLLGSIADILLDALAYLMHVSIVASEKPKEANPLKMVDLKPGPKKQAEAIQEKISKMGFECKLRTIYMARKDVKNNPKVVNGFVGFIKQFNSNDLGSLKPDMSKTATSTSYLMKASRLNGRKNRIVRAYIGRSMWRGRPWQILNVEELATIWHFPIESVVKAPLIQKTPGKKAEPPSTLPLGEDLDSGAFVMDDLFVMEQPLLSKTQPNKEAAENIFAFEAEEESARSSQPASSATTETYSDIFHSEEKAEPEVVKPQTERGTPPPNLPFA